MGFCNGIKRVSAGIWLAIHSSSLHSDSLPQPYAEETVIDDVATLYLAFTKVLCRFLTNCLSVSYCHFIFYAAEIT